ncbi:hypothetical protein DFH09DRAFT_16447 [Mycena vulgaris]|nr:hypothetical protein DFH09DRAFT_16447 [Mycena vulgaris]
MRPRCWWFAFPLLSGVAADRPVCDFTLGSLEFDLCPLFTGTSINVSVSEATPPTYTTHRYAVGLGAPLKRDGTLPLELQCPAGTWICLTVMNTWPSHPSVPLRILQVVPVAGDVGLSPKAKMLAKDKRRTMCMASIPAALVLYR